MADYKKTVVKPRFGSTIKETPIWRFDKIDRAGKFAFDLSRKDFNHKEILEKLIEYGRLTWDEIGRQQHDASRKSKHHYLSSDKLSKDAISRIKAKHLEEYVDLIYSFALQNKLRIIGIRRNEEFDIVWYDVNHEFCPSSKK